MNGVNAGRPFRLAATQRGARLPVCLAVAILPLLIAGCIERTLTIKTEPEDAVVTLNDQEVGRSPVRVPFTWYGDYDIIIRKQGYQTVHANERVKTPWYEYPLIDIVAEAFIPFTIHDDHVLDTFVLQPFEPPEAAALLDRAAEMRAQVTSEEAK